MLEVQQETRVDVLQEACSVLQNEVKRLSSKLYEQALRIAELEGHELTQAELDGLFQATPIVPSPPPKPKPRAKKRKKRKKPQTGHGPQPQPELAREERVFELPEDERICRICEGQLQEMGCSEDSEEITLVERTYKVTLNRRQKYRCRCNANVVTAPGPSKLIVTPRRSPSGWLKLPDSSVSRLAVSGQSDGARLLEGGVCRFEQIGGRIEAIETCGFDHRVENGGGTSASLGSRAEVILAPQDGFAQSPFDSVIVERDSAIFEESGQVVPALEHVGEGFAEIPSA